MSHPPSRSCYMRGCREPGCRAENTLAMQTNRLLAADRPVPEHVHGTHNGYAYWGCRCDACRTAKARHNREYRARRKLTRRGASGKVES